MTILLLSVKVQVLTVAILKIRSWHLALCFYHMLLVRSI